MSNEIAVMSHFLLPVSSLSFFWRMNESHWSSVNRCFVKGAQENSSAGLGKHGVELPDGSEAEKKGGAFKALMRYLCSRTGVLLHYEAVLVGRFVRFLTLYSESLGGPERAHPL